MASFEKLEEEIRKQQKKLYEYSPEYLVGEQILDFVKKDPDAAEIILADMQSAGMGLCQCEKQIKKFADAHKKGSCVCVPQAKVEEIIREYYKLPAPERSAENPERSPENTQQGKPKGGIAINLADFL